MARVTSRNARTRSFALALGVLVNAALLSSLLFRAPTALPTAEDDAPSISVVLARLPRTPVARARVARSSQDWPSSSKRAVSDPSPVTVAAPPSSAQASQAQAGDDPEALRGLLRSASSCLQIGRGTSTAEQRAACAKQVAEAARTAPHIDAVPEYKRKYYDQVVEAYASHSAPTPVATASSQTQSGERWLAPKGAHQPVLGCALSFGGGAAKKASGPPHALRLGPCFLAPPQGLFTEEADLPPPPSQPKP